MFRERYDKENLRIAYFAGTMQPGQDGVTRVLYRLIDELNRRGIPNVFFSPVIPPEKERPTEMVKVPAITFPLYKEYRLTIPGSKNFADRLKEFNPDIIHINSPFTLGYAAVKLGRKLGVPVAATYHTHFASYAKYYKAHAIESYSWNYFRLLYNRCDRVYVPSRPILKELRSHGINNTMFLPHGVDSEIFNPGFRSAQWRRGFGIEKKTVVLYAGRLVWEKDLKTLAETYRIIADKKRDDIAFVIAGSGPIKDELRRMMPKAVFPGYLTQKNLSIAYASSDIFVYPSTSETFGNAVLEAMASGIPAICVREGGAYDVIEDGITGLIARPLDAEDIASKILLLASDPVLRREMGEKACAFAREQKWSNIFDRLFESYREISVESKMKNVKLS